MNIHPIFVHFPIALFTLYSLAEFTRVRRLNSSSPWFYIKAFLVMIGGLSALVARQSGEIAQHLVTDSAIKQVVRLHSSWANISIAIYGTVGVIYFFAWIERAGLIQTLKSTFSKKYEVLGFLERLKKIIYSVVNILFRPWFLIILALAGLISITITGGLGGIIVFGPHIDPFTEFLYNVFNLSRLGL